MSSKIAILLLCTAIVASCAKAPKEETKRSELDWSKTSAVTLGDIALSSGSRAGEQLMASGQTFRLYAIDPDTKAIVATRTYTIDAATPGKPVVDVPQTGEVVLPYGRMDIFLVGPVKASVDGIEYEIATATGVSPRRGVDLVSSRTAIKVISAATSIDALPLQHRMVKLELEVSMQKDAVGGGDQATYINAKLDDPANNHNITFGDVGATGQFTFDDNGGSVTADLVSSFQYLYAVDNVGSSKIILKAPGEEVGGAGTGFTGAVYSVTDYICPSHITRPKLSLTYGYTRRSGEDKDVPAHQISGYTPNSQEWVGGTYVKISTTVFQNVNMTLRPQIYPWIDGGTSVERPVVNPNLLFWYSGSDAPETIDGKRCWRDRSGNGNHAEIVGNMQYDAATKSYYAADNAAHFKVPALGAVSAYTLELIAKSALNANNAAAEFSGTGGIYIHLPYGDTGSIVWYNKTDDNAGTSTNYTYATKDKYIFDALQSYAFCRSQTTAALVINGEQKMSVGKAGPWNDFNDNTLWSNSGGSDKRLYGARMYTSDMNTTAGRTQLAKNYADKLSQFGVKVPVNADATFDYVRDGLILDLRGTDAPQAIDSKTVWPDKSGKGNHATASAVHDAAINGYRISSGNDMRLVKSLGSVPEITIEITWSTPYNAESQVLISAANSPLYPKTNVMAIWWPYGSTDALIDLPFHDTSSGRIWLPLSEMITPRVDNISQISVSKSKESLINLRQNGYSYTSKNVVNTMQIPELNNVAIGGLLDESLGKIARFSGVMYSVRIYNRALSEQERQHNYLVDKQKYKILP